MQCNESFYTKTKKPMTKKKTAKVSEEGGANN